MVQERNRDSFNKLRIRIQWMNIILITVIILFLGIGGTAMNIRAAEKSFDQNLQDTAELITRVYCLTRQIPEENLTDSMDSIISRLPDVDVISIVNAENLRIYHTNHELIGTSYDGKVPDFSSHKEGFCTEDSLGPSGPQRRTYSVIYDDYGNYQGFIMTIMLRKTIKMFTIKSVMFFIGVVIAALIVEIIICSFFYTKTKQQFKDFAEDLEGTKHLVDSMRANNHDFTNKLHVILGLIQIGQYDKAISYIENISIIQRGTLSKVMNAVEQPAVAALIIGKIARSSECNVKFILKENSTFKNSDIDIPSEALVTICGNLIENAIDSMNKENSEEESKELNFGIFTKQGELLITVEDNGCGIPEEIADKVFEKGFSTKGEGRGVGLYHTKQLVESLGGSISFESQFNIGTSFMVVFKR